MSGSLYLVGTPIGNLGDLSPRAVDTLLMVDLIAAEDTRRTGLLLKHISCDTRMISFHMHNERSRVPEILGRLERGESVAVVSDAGNPGISDPAETLVRAAVQAAVPVVPVPGPSAFVAALIASGLATRRFRFEGFLPAKQGPRQKRLEQLRSEQETIIFYESPRRVERLLKEIDKIMGNREAVLAREITKKFEEFARGPVRDLSDRLKDHPPRGEFVVLVEGAGEDAPLPPERVLAIARETAVESSLRDTVRLTARLAGWKEQDVYRLLKEKG